MKRAHPPCSDTDLARLQRALGGQLPPSYLTFLREHDGCWPESNSFMIEPGHGSTVTEFYSARKVLSQKQQLGDRLSKGAWPIALTESGNLVILFQDDHSSRFWDHELEDETVVAANFTDFLEGLRAFAVSEVKLKPGQVVSAWIDPDLLKSPKKE